MKLYENAFSPFARKVRMVPEYKGLSFDCVDGLLPASRKELAAVNPRLEVPVLYDDGVIIVNSSDIVAYLDHKYPGNPVLPADPATRVRARTWERRGDTEIDAILHDISLFMWSERSDTCPSALLAAAARDLGVLYTELDQALSGSEFLCGTLSIAEIALFPHLSSVRLLGVPFSPDQHPNLFAWYRRLRALPLFADDLKRVQNWLSTMAGSKPTRIVWRGDRIEWLLQNGHHDWFLSEIQSGRAVWPKA